MWKSILDAVIEAFAASEPNVYLYWRCARLQREEEARSEPPERGKPQAGRLRVVRTRTETTV
jgi:hypothetical protein